MIYQGSYILTVKKHQIKISTFFSSPSSSSREKLIGKSEIWGKQKTYHLAMLFAFSSIDSNALVELLRAVRSQGMLVLMFMGDLSNFTDGSDVKINDLGKNFSI